MLIVNCHYLQVTVNDDLVSTMRRYASMVYAVIMCTSVCVSVLQRWLNLGSCRQCSTITHGFLFIDAKDLGEIPTGSSPTVVPNRGWIGYSRWLLTNILLYLGNGTRQEYSYYGTLIGTRMRSIKWRYFQWLWVTHNYPKPPHFPHIVSPYVSL